MPHLLGIDLGTSSVKAIIIDETATIIASAAREYRIRSPQPGWAEQSAQEWCQAVADACQEAIASREVDVVAVGFSGQMHGTVLIDDELKPLGDAIIWPDRRAVEEVAHINATLGDLAAKAGTLTATGFMAATLLWLQRHDPERLGAARYALLPKDYVRLRLTGVVGTDTTDASSTGLFDVGLRRWSAEICAALGLPLELLPPVHNPAEVVGALTPDAAEALGLPAGILVVAGAADQAAQAVGNGLLAPGQGSVTVGSGGQVFVPLSAPTVDLRLHTFCHAPPQRWYQMGAMLTAGLSLRWLRDLLGDSSFAELEYAVSEAPPGAQGLYFLPYLSGERAPLNDPLARGCFIGLTLEHDRRHLARAVMEGVGFALRQIITLMEAPITNLLAVGGGLGSPVWRQIVADILGHPLRRPTGHERSGVGAALMAGIGAEVFPDYDAVGALIMPPEQTTTPDPNRAAFYAERYQRYTQLYPLLSDHFHQDARLM